MTEQTPADPHGTVTDETAEGFRQTRFAPPAGATQVLLVRHGESAPLHPDRPFPQRDGHGDPELDPVGAEQARRLADRLAGERVDAIYVTVLRRTHQTAAPLAERLGLVPVEVADLREVHLGEWEGGELRRRAAQADPLLHRLYADERWDVIPGAEPMDAFADRVERGLGAIVDAHPDGRVVAVLHGGVIGEILHQVTGSHRFAFTGADNASISEIVVSPARTLLRRYNDTSHL